VGVKVIGPKETLEFRQQVKGTGEPWRFLAANMSDGTLRGLGILVALFQGCSRSRVPMVGIEEPEIALHPAAATVLRDSMKEASTSTQILVTSHCPDLLDDEALDAPSLLAVVADEGTTRVGPIDEIGRDKLRDRLYTAGELLRRGELQPEKKAPAPEQLPLFDEAES
jgi:predicted ATPase